MLIASQLLLPALLATSAPRVINVSSLGHNWAPATVGFYWDKLKGPKTGTMVPLASVVERYRYYGSSKLVSWSALILIVSKQLCRETSFSPRN